MKNWLEIFKYFFSAENKFLIPVIIVLMVIGIVLTLAAVSGGASPYIYTLF